MMCYTFSHKKKAKETMFSSLVIMSIVVLSIALIGIVGTQRAVVIRAK